MSGFFSKCPSRELILRLDFRQAGLRPDECIIGDQGWLVFPEDASSNGLVCTCAACDHTVARCCLVGGLPGRTYFVTAQIITDFDRILKRTVVVRVSNNKELSR